MSEHCDFPNEDSILAQLEHFGVDYINNPSGVTFTNPLSPVDLIISTIHQPSSRVRTSLIALFLVNPSFSSVLEDAQSKLPTHEIHLLKIFFTAAVYLQEKYLSDFKNFLGRKWQPLPDRFSNELGIPNKELPDEKIRMLDSYHKKISGSYLNWTGYYKSIAQHVLHSFELKNRWKH